jgi:hypothetical protein
MVIEPKKWSKGGERECLGLAGKRVCGIHKHRENLSALGW